MKTGETASNIIDFLFTNVKSNLEFTFHAKKCHLTKNIPEWAGVHEVNYVIDQISNYYYYLQYKHHYWRKYSIVFFVRLMKILLDFMFVTKKSGRRKPFSLLKIFNPYFKNLKIINEFYQKPNIWGKICRSIHWW